VHLHPFSKDFSWISAAHAVRILHMNFSITIPISRKWCMQNNKSSLYPGTEYSFPVLLWSCISFLLQWFISFVRIASYQLNSVNRNF